MELNSRPPPPPEAETKENLLPMAAEGIPATNPPPPTTERRPRRRAREVSSRYMMTASLSPISSSSSSSSSNGDSHHLALSPRVACPSLPLPKKQQRQWRSPSAAPSSPDATDSEPEPSSRYADENQQAGSVRRSLEAPMGTQSKAATTQKKRAAVRLFSDNGGEPPPATEPLKPNEVKRRPRPGTPMVYPADRTSTSPRGADPGRNLLRSIGFGTAAARRAHPRPPTPARANPCPPGAESGDGHGETSSENSSTVADFSDSETCSVSGHGGLCISPPLRGRSSSRGRRDSDLRSSMPEADLLPTMSVRRKEDGCSRRQDGFEDSSGRTSTPFCYRSLNSALSSCQQQPFNSSKSIDRTLVPSKPPQLPNSKLGLELKKGRKASGRQEDIHMLRLLHNRYVQWKFVNAKAQAAMGARNMAAEKSLFGLSVKISELQSSVTEKRIELAELKRRESIFSILEAQMPYLDEWMVLEEDYSGSLSGATRALQDASLRLPISGNVRVDIRELKEVLESAMYMLESLSPCIGSFLPKAEGIEDVASDLAGLVSTERSLIEECANLLSEAHNLQVKECSVRSQLIQLKQSHIDQENSI